MFQILCKNINTTENSKHIVKYNRKATNASTAILLAKTIKFDQIIFL